MSLPFTLTFFQVLSMEVQQMLFVIKPCTFLYCAHRSNIHWLEPALL